MSYDDYDLSIDSSKPIELYEFVLTDGWTARYTTGKEITIGYYIYKAAPIARTRLRQGDNVLKDSVTLTVPRGHELAQELLNALIEIDSTTSVTIKRLQLEAIDDPIVLWKGHVSGISASEETVEIVCQSIYKTMQRMCLIPKYELICRHPLYSGTMQCSVNQPDFKTNGIVSEILDNGYTLRVQEAASKEDGYFRSGMIEYEGMRRTIKTHATIWIGLTMPVMPGLVAGETIAMYPGCDKTLNTCKNKFNNNLNFGGFPWMSPKNPFESGLE